MPAPKKGSTTATRCDWYLAVYVGNDKLGWVEDPNAGRLESRMWDMLRYDRCYPASNGERFRDMGFYLLKQPYQKDIMGGFTLGRWESKGFKYLIQGPASTSGSVSFAMEEHCREYANDILIRQRERERGNLPKKTEV